MTNSTTTIKPFSIDDWEDDLLRRYPEPDAESTESFREYGANVPARVREFYRMNHERQTMAFVAEKRAKYLPLRKTRMGIWEAMEFLNTLVDDSDPDTELSQIEHLIQTAEAIRHDGLPRWFILTGLIHDLGKILCLWGEPQWAVVGDTFPVGCNHSDKIVFTDFFKANPDAHDPRYNTLCGAYKQGCGLDNVLLSWGHDEYMYNVAKPYLPVEALYMIRYHSFYAAHREGEYQHLMNEQDQHMLRWIRLFSRYDLYTKHDTRPNVEALRPYYEQLIGEYFPQQVEW